VKNYVQYFLFVLSRDAFHQSALRTGWIPPLWSGCCDGVHALFVLVPQIFFRQAGTKASASPSPLSENLAFFATGFIFFQFFFVPSAL
jgi:hypothetical protein